MNTNSSHAARALASRYPAIARNDAIEWEEMPSITLRAEPVQPAALKLVLRSEAADFNSAWGITMPAALDTMAQPTPFREMISGLVMREVNEPELFKHFFG